MHKLLVGVLATGALLLALPGAAQGSEGAGDLAQPRPSWLTAELEAQIVAAGPRGLEVRLSKEQETEVNCLGTSPPYAGTDGVSLTAVSAGGCMVAPHGCTMNFVFERDGDKYIGSAGHCLQGGGNVIMQVSTRVDPTDTVIVGLAAIGKAGKKVNAGIGRDFGVVRIAPGFKVVPGVAGGLGPTGVFCGDPLGQPVLHYGHGYVFAVEQGIVKFGEVIPDVTLFRFTSEEHGFNWVGYGLPGDSGSPVMDPAGLAVGDLTHGIGVLGVPIPGLNFGTTTAGMFEILGSGYSLVTVDGRKVSCSGAVGGLVGV